MVDYIEIDGARGEGGGQILRTSLTLSALTNRPVHVANIRAGRTKPGLLRQHLAVVRALKEITGADLTGDELGSSDVWFNPDAPRAGDYEFAIGSAGSTTLLFQSVFPVLAYAPGRSTVKLSGGTHNGMAPSVDFIEQVFLPRIQQLGFKVVSSLDVHGFYPNGGGVWNVVIEPVGSLKSMKLLERGDLVSTAAVVSHSNLGLHIAERQLASVAKKLSWSREDMLIEHVRSPGPGNIVSLRAQYGHGTELFESAAELRLSAEKVARRAINAFRKYDESTAGVCPFLADQLMLPMVVGAGGEYTTHDLSDHTRTNVDVINRFVGETKVSIEERASDVLITVQPIRV